MKELILLEFRKNLFGGRFLAACLLILVTFFISLGMMMQEYSSRNANYMDSKSLKGSELFFNNFWYWQHENGETDTSNTITWPMAKVKRPEPLMFFSRGTERITSQSAEFINKFPIVDTTMNPEQEANLLKVLFPAPDILLVVKVLVSLIAILFGYSLLSNERERGTLKLILVCGASRSSTFIGKYIGGLFSIWAAFSISFLIYLLSLVSFTPVDLRTGEAALRIGLIFLAFMLFLAVFYSLGVVLSAFNRNSSPSLILALFFWLFLVFILPGIASLAAQQFVQVESKDTIDRLKLETAQAMERDYEASHPDATNSGSTAGYGRVHDAIRQQVADEMEKIDSEHRIKKAVQIELTTNLSRASPAGSLTFLLSGLSRTGIQDLKRFRQDLHTIKQEIESSFMQAFQDPTITESFNNTSFEVNPLARDFIMKMFDLADDYRFSSLTIHETLDSCWLDFALLFTAVLTLFILGFVRFQTYDPR